MTARKATSPFDAAAAERHRRMGLVDGDGKANVQAIKIIARAHAGMFFDERCEHSDSEGGVLLTITRLSKMRETAQPWQVFITICIAYDEMRLPLPDLIWWISGNMELVSLFVGAFVDSLKAILRQIQNGGGNSA